MYNVQRQHQRSIRGSALVTVLILTTVVSLVFAAYMRFAMFERKSITRYQLQTQAELTAESLANYAAAQIVNEFEEQPVGMFEDYPNGVFAISDTVKALVDSPNIDPNSLQIFITTRDDPYNLDSNFERFDIEMNPANLDDPEYGEMVTARTIYILASATAKDFRNSGSEVSAFVEYSLQLRQEPFLDSAYQGLTDDGLSFLPEQRMTVEGKVHSNGNIYVSSTAGLDFMGKVTAAGRFIHGVEVTDGDKFERALGDVRVINDDGDLVSIRRTDGMGNPFDGSQFSHWIDNNPQNIRADGAPTWLDEMESLWGGFLEDGVDPITLPGLEENNEYNDNYASIEPVVPWNSDTDLRAAQEASRDLKYALHAGLVLQITNGNARVGDKPNDPISGPIASFEENTYEVQAFKYERDGEGEVVFNADGSPKMIEVKLPAGVVGDANGSMDAIERDARVESFSNVAGSVSHEETDVPVWAEDVFQNTVSLEDRLTTLNGYWDHQLTLYTPPTTFGTEVAHDIEAKEAELQTHYEEFVTTIEENRRGAIDNWTALADADGNVVVETRALARDADGNLIQALDGVGNPIWTTVTNYTTYEYVDGGFVDYREGRYMDSLYLDVGELKRMVSMGDADYDSSPWATDYANRSITDTFDPANDWNGTVYIQAPIPDTINDRRIVTTDPNLAVTLINGKELPSQEKSNGEQGGFILATNAPVYTVGSYNANGELHNGTRTTPDDREVPALIVAETITVLSDEFKDASPVPADPATLVDGEWQLFAATGRRQLYGDATSDPAAIALTPLEISAGFISGTSPTVAGEYDQQSGGAHNQIRFLQDWQPTDSTATTVRYRGSIVILFDTESHTQHLPADYQRVFSAPAREYSDNPFFMDGIYPGGGNNDAAGDGVPDRPKSYHREAVKHLTAAEFQNLISHI